MKTTLLICAVGVLVCGCARKSELDKARADLVEAQRKIDQLESERVPRAQYDIARASLRIADERIATLEKNLNAAYDLMAEQQINVPPEIAANTPSQNSPSTPPPNSFRLANGGYVASNDTRVYGSESELEFGQHLKVSSPTGLMVTDPDQKVVGGDLSIKGKGVTMASEDGVLMANDDGTVKFVGNNLTMKFDEKKPVAKQSTEPNLTEQPLENPPTAPAQNRSQIAPNRVVTGGQ